MSTDGRDAPTGPADGRTDGRRARGEARRRALIEAVLQVVERDGAAGVTHRSAAREAGLPDSAATYYFAGVDDLLTAALTESLADAVALLTGLAERPETADPERGPRALARILAGYAAAPGRVRADYELYLLASRRPELRALAQTWVDGLTALFGRWIPASEPDRVRSAAAAVDGMLLQSLMSGTPYRAGEFERLLRAAIGGPPRGAARRGP